MQNIFSLHIRMKRLRYCIERSATVSKETQYVSKETQYVSKETQYVSKETQYVAKETQYVSKETQYVAKETQYVSKETQYVSKETQYVSLVTRPFLQRPSMCHSLRDLSFNLSLQDVFAIYIECILCILLCCVLFSTTITYTRMCCLFIYNVFSISQPFLLPPSHHLTHTRSLLTHARSLLTHARSL